MKSYKLFFLFLIGLLTAALPLFFYEQHPSHIVRIDAAISKGDKIEIFVDHQNFQLPITTSARSSYEFINIPHYFNHFRIDFSDQNNATAKICKIEFFDKNKTLKKTITGNEIKKWDKSAVEAKEDNSSDSCIDLQSLSSDPIVTTHFSRLNYFNENELKTYNLLAPPSRALIVFFWLFIFLFSTRSIKDFFVLTLSSLLFMNLSQKISERLQSLFTELPEPLQVAGWIHYHGYPKSTDYLIFIALGLLSFIFALIIQKKFKLYKDSSLNQASASFSKFDFFIPFFSIIILLLYVWPSFLSSYDQITNPQHNLGRDALNGYTWKFFYESGYLPFKDFWYPYGSQNTFLGPFFENQIWMLLHKFIYLTAFIYSIYQLFKDDLKFYFLTLFGALILYLLDFFNSPDRYFASFSILLFSTLLIWRQITNSSSSSLLEKLRAFASLLLVALANLWILHFEIHQAIYIILGQIIFFAILLLNQAKRKNTLIYFLSFITLNSIYITLYFTHFLSKEQRSGIIGFFKESTSFTQNASLPNTFSNYLENSYTTESFLYFLVFFLIFQFGLVFFEKSKSFNFSHKDFSFFFTGAFITYLAPLIYKQITRPHMALQLVGLIIIATIICLMYQIKKNRFSFYQLAFLSLMAGFCLIQVYRYHLTDKFKDQISQSYQKLISPWPEQVYFKIGDQKLRQSFFSNESLFYKSLRGDEIKNQLQKFIQNDKFYVLGDQSFLYTLFKQSSPYNITFYDGAPLNLQKNTISWIKENQVQKVIWEPQVDFFDEVPHILRVPRIFEFIVNNFSPKHNFNPYVVLEKVSSSQGKSVSSWLSYLPKEINYRSLLRPYDDNLWIKDCSLKPCEKIFVIEIKALPKANDDYEFTIVDNEKNEFTIKLTPKASKVYLPFRNIWFMSLLKSYNIKDNEQLSIQTLDVGFKNETLY